MDANREERTLIVHGGKDKIRILLRFAFVFFGPIYDNFCFEDLGRCFFRLLIAGVGSGVKQLKRDREQETVRHIGRYKF